MGNTILNNGKNKTRSIRAGSIGHGVYQPSVDSACGGG